MLNNLSDSLSTLLTQEFASISIEHLLLTLLLSFGLSLYLVLIYRIIYSGVLFSKRFALSLVLLALVTSVVILAISSNVVLSLGMVGALSIVRFRTAVKDAMDTIFMFWAIVIGIVTGAGFVLISCVSTLVIGILILLLYHMSKRFHASDYLVVIHLDSDAALTPLLNKLPKHHIKARNTNELRQEVIFEVRLTDEEAERVQKLSSEPTVQSVNIIACNTQTVL